jgi:DNA-binding XRE family transcriptional regulator
MAARKFAELRAQIVADPVRAERLRRVTESVDRSYESYQLNLRQLRQARNLTQTRLAKILGISQPEVSRIEHQADVYLSTLQSYVAAMGGDLELLVVFGDQEPTPVDAADVLPSGTPYTPGEVKVTVASEVHGPVGQVYDINEVVAAEAIDREHRAHALRGIVEFLRQHSMPNLADVLSSFAAEGT